MILNKYMTTATDGSYFCSVFVSRRESFGKKFKIVNSKWDPKPFYGRRSLVKCQVSFMLPNLSIIHFREYGHISMDIYVKSGDSRFNPGIESRKSKG